MKKTISLLLVLVLLLSLIPMGAAAAENWAWKLITQNTTEYHYEDGTYVIYANKNGWILESTHPDYKSQISEQYNPGDPDPIITLYDPTHVHLFGQEISRDGHFIGCICGVRKGSITPHVDPKDAVDGRCTCGYEYVGNAKLSVLWISGVKLDKPFQSGVNEYKATLVNKEAKAVDISAFTMDDKAQLEVSGDMILKAGTNTITLKVTAEDGTENTYTVTIEK